MSVTLTRIERSQAELRDAIFIAAHSIANGITAVAALGNFDFLVATMSQLYDLAKLAEEHRDCVDADELVRIAGPTAPLEKIFRCCLQELRNEANYLAHREWQHSWRRNLPTGEWLHQVVLESEDGMYWEGLTFWKEESGWSVTNAYGVDHVAFVATPGSFQSLIDQMRENDGEIGPVPPMCQDDHDDYDPAADFMFHIWDAADQMTGGQLIGR